MSRAWMLLVPAVLGIAPATRAERHEPTTFASGYCAMLKNEVASETSLHMSPTLFVSAGIVNFEQGPAALSLVPTRRVIAGIKFGPLHLVRAILHRRVAAAECDRMEAANALDAFVRRYRTGASRQGLEAKLAVLRDSRGEAEQIVKRTQLAVERGLASVDELTAVTVRLDILRSLTDDVAVDLEAEPPAVQLPTVHDMLEALEHAEERVFDRESGLRIASAFDIEIHAGYDKFFRPHHGAEAAVAPGGEMMPAAEPHELPLFGFVSVKLNPGVLAMPSYESRARHGHHAYIKEQELGTYQRATQALARLKAQAARAQRREGELRALLADLERRHHDAGVFANDRIRRYRDQLWFDMLRVRADLAYVCSQRLELARLVGAEEAH
jgi:hypothetical protein